MSRPKPYSRVIRFQHVGLHTRVEDLVANVRISDAGFGPHIVQDLDSLISAHVRPLLAHDGDLRVDVHPDQGHGFVYGRAANSKEPVLAAFTVHLVDEDVPAADTTEA
ncbi:hypothetical protein BJF83_18890 [Nocardiopsis sp. CNR-923]|uniref:hypothetical protein n=1 Tax=Nocardiopsis sp. CNR-923 TaxID=1904965 RepID=UPI00095C4F32|nr:hypothetical protein [Nocardiopsis sp. CNR-923]OLT27162.1 hypothetical protein BJF83_18890 [Nocardiopsis sp. CNR-923]